MTTHSQSRSRAACPLCSVAQAEAETLASNTLIVFRSVIRNHSKTVALYCAQQGWAIRCNSVHPAAILTSIWEPMLGTGPDREAKIRALVADTPLKRFGTPEEVAAIAVMLASDEATNVAGTEVNIDGGLLAGSAASPG